MKIWIVYFRSYWSYQNAFISTKYAIRGYTDCPKVVVRTSGNDIGVDYRKYEDDFFRRVLFLIFLRCHVNCDGQRLKYVIGFSVILLQAQLDIYDSNNDRIQNYSVTEHHLYSGSWN